MFVPAASEAGRGIALRAGVLLDRDGVLNRALVRDGRPYPPATLDELEILDGVPEACGRLAAAGFVLVAVTNQPDVARGITDAQTVERINQYLRARLGLHDILTCQHDDADGCLCRKPRPGLLLRAAQVHDLDLTRSVMVGDRWRDIEAGRRAGCRTAFIDHCYRERRPDAPDFTCQSLAEAVPFILEIIQERPQMAAKDAYDSLTAA